MKSPAVDTVVFNGRTFRRYPRSKDRGNRLYYRCVANGETLFLHREVWKYHHGREVPDGFHVHHDDDDQLNNEPENLVLLSAAEHASRHHKGRRLSATERARVLAQLDRAKAWHSTPEGLAFHRRAAMEFVEALPTKELKCAVCGKVRTVKAIGRHGSAGSRFCSNDCRYKGGADRENRTCRVCKKTFQAIKWRPQTATCSRSCANRARKGTPYYFEVVR